MLRAGREWLCHIAVERDSAEAGEYVDDGDLLGERCVCQDGKVFAEGLDIAKVRGFIRDLPEGDDGSPEDAADKGHGQEKKEESVTCEEGNILLQGLRDTQDSGGTSGLPGLSSYRVPHRLPVAMAGLVRLESGQGNG